MYVPHLLFSITSLPLLFQLLASSRQTFAFSRDGALPFSRFIRQINPHTKTPIYGVWMGAAAALALGLLGFAGSDAITAVFALGVAGQNVAYCIPIVARILSGKRFVHGPFYLGKWVSESPHLVAMWSN